MNVIIDADILCHDICDMPYTYIEDLHRGGLGSAFMQMSIDCPHKTWDMHLELLYTRLEWFSNRLGVKQDNFVFAFTDDNREDLFRNRIKDKVPYKENRIGKEKPQYYWDLVEYIRDTKQTRTVPGYEADDIIGIYMQFQNWMAISCDKDLRTCPGVLFNDRQNKLIKISDPGRLKLYKTSRRKKPTTEIVGKGFKWFCAQMLLGDTADNVPGVPKIGPVGAYRILHSCTTKGGMLQAVEKAYTDAGVLDTFEETADLLWILREPNKTWRDLL